MRTPFLETGPTGRARLAHPGARGPHIRALARDPAALPAADGLEVVRGDVRDPSSLRAALDGVDAVIGAFGVSGFARAFAPTDLHSQGTRDLLGSMRAAGAGRLLMRSSAAVLHDPAAGIVWSRPHEPHRRLEGAKGLLRARPDLQVAEVALRCGFPSLSAFSHAFRKREGEAPSRWARRARTPPLPGAAPSLPPPPLPAPRRRPQPPAAD